MDQNKAELEELKKHTWSMAEAFGLDQRIERYNLVRIAVTLKKLIPKWSDSQIRWHSSVNPSRLAALQKLRHIPDMP